VICKGTGVVFDLVDGARVIPPARYGMLHDPSGKEWPARSVLVGPFAKGPLADEDEIPRDARDYLGRKHRVHRGVAIFPPRSLATWTHLGDVASAKKAGGRIRYVRGGTKAPGGFHHPFNAPSLATLMKGHGRSVLYRCGQWLRLELPRGAMLDARGFVWP